jgi:hypothetical protein
MGSVAHDTEILRALAGQYAAIAALPVQEDRRRLWSAHFALKPVRPPVLVFFGYHNAWCREVFGDETLRCRDPFFRAHERELRLKLFHHTLGDDFICEPWLTQPAVHTVTPGKCGEPWGCESRRHAPSEAGGAYKETPPIADWSDVARLQRPNHGIDEVETARLAGRLHDAVGDLLPVDVPRGSVFLGLSGDISTNLGAVRGMEQIMLDLYESPAELKALVARMGEDILANQERAEAAGDYRLTAQMNQAMVYADELPRPVANSAPCRRRDLWGLGAAQEFTLVSPAFHEEFLLRYQKPILDAFGLVHYGCCENLTRKIPMLRQLKTLRSIAVTPSADVAACAEQIGTDYAFSWRPSPTDMVCLDWDEPRIRRLLEDGLARARGTRLHVNLKDVETVCGDPTRLARWTRLVRDTIDQVW